MCCISHGCPENCLPYPVESCLVISEGIIDVLLVLQIFFAQHSKIGNILCCA